MLFNGLEKPECQEKIRYNPANGRFYFEFDLGTCGMVIDYSPEAE